HLRDHVLPELLQRARSGGRVRIWSAASSDGQEPYSIALTVLSLMPNVADYDFKILATDIDPKILAIARAGAYDES
ncbi:CheR family methyltransferase, partial [Rhizobium johnstonii]